MPRGGYRPGAGRPKGAKRGASTRKLSKREIKEIAVDAKAHGLSPLEYMLKVMNNAEADQGRRDRMAVAAAPYCHSHPKEVEKGKKEQRQEAAQEAARGRFAPAEPPKLVVDNK